MTEGEHPAPSTTSAYGPQQKGSASWQGPGVDLSADASSFSLSAEGKKYAAIGNSVLEEATARRRFRYFAVAAAMTTLVVLLYVLTTTVCSYVSHVDRVGEALISWQSLVDTQAHAASTSASSTASAPSPSKASSGATAAGKLALSESITHFEGSLKTIATSIVAISTVLVVAATVLAIAFMRSAFTLTLHHEESPQATPKAKESDIALPGVEMVKAVGEAFATALKGLPPGKS